MHVQVRFFSLLRERAGVAQTELELPLGATVAQAVTLLGTRYPSLEPLLRADANFVLISRNRDYAAPTDRLSEGDEVALLPPVSGGSEPVSPAFALGRGLLLLSGGFDSPVAGRLAQAHGATLDAVHFSMEPFTDDASSRKATELARVLGFKRLTIVPIGPSLAEFARRCDPQCYFVLQKRFMIRLAETLAAQTGASFLITGENLGQVSSQTLENLGAIDAAATLPVVRPLLGWDKTDIIQEARSIGTYDLSCGPEVCDVLGPKHPSTRVALDRVQAEEAQVDLEALERQAWERAFEVDPHQGYVARALLSPSASPQPRC